MLSVGPVKNSIAHVAKRYVSRRIASNYSREYFYSLDSRGELFLEETFPKTIATSLKDHKFLKFFYGNIRANDTGLHSEIPFVSLCGNERNYLKPPDDICALVFTDLINGSKTELAYCRELFRQNFDINLLKICGENGRIYHAIVNHRYLVGFQYYGLLHYSIASKLSYLITEKNGTYYINWENKIHELQVI